MAPDEEAANAELEGQGGRLAWLEAEMDGLPVRTWILIGLGIAIVVLGVGAWWTYRGPGTQADQAMSGGAMQPANGNGVTVPPVEGLYAGERVLFVHTEASDPEVAGLLTDMMGSPVLVVPELARVPASALAAVYVFTNGVEGGGPMGFQPDVFDSAPGGPGYSPLREVRLVTWEEGAGPRLLDSAEAVEEAGRRGEVRIEPTGVVVNMPFLAWPGGQR